jgi:hypothetical protein
VKKLIKERDMDTIDTFEGILYTYNKVKNFTTIEEFVQHFNESGFQIAQILK